jgi:hypothetical protein
VFLPLPRKQVKACKNRFIPKQEKHPLSVLPMAHP